jgi:KipI family sensor histidine kinase inhibitor
VLLDGLDDPAATARQIESWTVAPASADAGRIVEIRCTYDGPDLASVASHWRVPAAEVARFHASIVHQVAFCGFAPGFAYLTGIGADRSVPRRPSPRSSVPGGSVALAGPYTGIYPRPSPGGWNLIGRTDAVLWDPARPLLSGGGSGGGGGGGAAGGGPALLSPGTRVRFVTSAAS